MLRCVGCSFYRQCVPEGIGNRRVNVSVVATQHEQMREKFHSEEGIELCAV